MLLQLWSLPDRYPDADETSEELFKYYLHIPAGKAYQKKLTGFIGIIAIHIPKLLQFVWWQEDTKALSKYPVNQRSQPLLHNKKGCAILVTIRNRAQERTAKCVTLDKFCEQRDLETYSSVRFYILTTWSLVQLNTEPLNNPIPLFGIYL